MGSSSSSQSKADMDMDITPHSLSLRLREWDVKVETSPRHSPSANKDEHPAQWGPSSRRVVESSTCEAADEKFKSE